MRYVLARWIDTGEEHLFIDPPLLGTDDRGDCLLCGFAWAGDLTPMVSGPAASVLRRCIGRDLLCAPKSLTILAVMES